MRRGTVKRNGRFEVLWPWYGALLFVSIILAFTPIRLLSLLVIIYVLSRFVRVGFGLVGKLVVSFLLVATVTTCVAGLAWLVHLPLDTGWMLSMYAIGLLVLATGVSRPPALLPSKAEVLNLNDIIALLVAIVFMGVLVRPLSRHPSAATLGPVIMAGGDNSTHLKLIRTDDINHGYSIGKHNRANLTGVLISYPQGWHVNVAFLKWVIEPLVNLTASPSRFLMFYYSVIALWFGILTFLITRIALWVKRSLESRFKYSEAVWSSLLVGVACAIGIAGWLISLFEFGFQTELAALTLLLVEILFIIKSYEFSGLTRRYAYLAVAGLALAAGNFAYLFLAPVGGIILLGAFLHTWASTKKVPNVLWPVLIIIAGLVIFQPAVQELVKVPAAAGITGGAINDTGDVIHTSMYPLLGFGAALAAFTYLFFRNQRVRWLFYTAAAALIFTLLIMFYQLHTVHGLRYYYFKSTYTFIMLVVTLGAAALGVLLNSFMRVKVPRRQWTVPIIVGSLSLLVGMMLFWSWKSPIFDDFTHARLQGISPIQAATVADIVRQNPDNALRLTSMGSCNRGDDIRTANFAQAIAYTTNNQVGYSSFELSFLSKNYLFWSIKNYTTKRHIHLIVLSNDQLLGNELMQYMGKDAGYVQLINIDPNPAADLTQQCPERIRTLTPAEIAKGIK